MNKKLNYIFKFVPSEFGRVYRNFDEFSNWKSTKYRQFLLYSGIFILKDSIDEDSYFHFLLLHAGIRLLCNNENLEEFVNLFGVIYGAHLISFNIHGLLHVTNCVKQCSPLDNFSAYKFENYMQYLKKVFRAVVFEASRKARPKYYFK